MSESSPPREYEIVIQPTTGWLDVRWRELWDYRDLLVVLVQRDFISRYKQTILGPLWFVLQSVLQTLLFTIVFGRVAGIPTEDIPSPLFYLCGLLGWNYFNQNITTAGATFVNNSHLFGKVWFPRLIMPLSAILSNLVALGLQALPFFAFFIYYKVFTHEAHSVAFGWPALLVLFPLAQLALLSLGISLWISASTAKYRDLVHLTQFLMQLWMFATPIFYPIALVREKWPILLFLNPVTVPVEAMRICLLGRGSLLPGETAVSVIATVVLLVTGLAAFQRVERTAVDCV